MDVKTLTVEQLKALAYDQIFVRENADRNLRILNDEIVKRAKVDEKVEDAITTG